MRPSGDGARSSSADAAPVGGDLLPDSGEAGGEPLLLRRWAMVFLTALVVARAPELLTDPRMWAEEGTKYFLHAHNSSLWETLVWVYGPAGYYFLFANVAAAVADLLPLRYAPYAGTYLSAGLLLLVAYHVMATPSAVWSGVWRRVLLAVLLVMSPAMHGEVWLNSVNTQVHLGIAAVFILLQPATLTAWQRRRSLGLLAVGVLSGVYVVVLAPLFLLRAALRRTRTDLWQAGVVGVGALLQAVVILVYRVADELAATRGGMPDVAEAASRTFQLQVLGPVLGSSPARDLRVLLLGDEPTLAGGLAVLVVLAVLFAGVVLAVSPRLRLPLLALGATFVGVTLVTAVTTLGLIWTRYAVVPAFVVLCILVTLTERDASRWLRVPAGVLLCISLAMGVGDFGFDGEDFYDCEECPSWRSEVEAWEQDPDHRLQVWPNEGWTIQLDEES